MFACSWNTCDIRGHWWFFVFSKLDCEHVSRDIHTQEVIAQLKKKNVLEKRLRIDMGIVKKLFESKTLTKTNSIKSQ